MNSRYSHDRLVETAEEATRGALFLFGGSAAATIVAVLCSIVVARLLGPELYGVYAISLVVPGFLLLFTDFGVSSALTRFSAKLKAEGEASTLACLVRNGFLFKALTILPVFILGLLFFRCSFILYHK